MHSGHLEFNLGGEVIMSQRQSLFGYIMNFLRNMWGPIAANLFLAAVLIASGIGWTYWLWVIAYFTTYQFCLRIRSIAEHSVVPDHSDNHRNTRTTKANFLERLLFAPHFVNYHAEHHLLMTVPPYNLPRMHELIRERGYYKEGLLKDNYWSIIRLAIG